MTESQTKKVISAIEHLLNTSNTPSVTITEILDHDTLQFEVEVQHGKKVSEIALNHDYKVSDYDNTDVLTTGSILRIGPNAIKNCLKRMPKR